MVRKALLLLLILMSTTVSKLANTSQSVSETTAWQNTANAQSKTDADAVSTNATSKNTTNTRSWGFPAFTTSDIPDDATISSVLLRYRYSSSTTGVSGGQLVVQGDNNGSTFGSATNEAQTTTLTTHTIDITANVTLSDLRTANKIRCRFGSQKGNTNSALTWNLEYVELEVTFSSPAFDQTSFRFYADGTESGSTALAAQDTNYTADLSSGNLNLGLRVRVQETGGAAGASDDDYALVVSKNGGSYKLARTLLDSYSESNVGLFTGMGYTGADSHDGQAFTVPADCVLKKLQFYLKKLGSPTDNVTGEVYATDASGVPTGSALAASSNSVAASSLSTSAALVDLLFTGLALTGNTRYAFFAAFFNAANNSSNRVEIGLDISSPTHPGDRVYKISGTFNKDGVDDTAFYAYTDVDHVDGFNSSNLTDGNATTNRLGAGSGSFVAGEISEDSVVDDLQITANNYTELLFSVSIVAANLADGDTLDFRVVRNGVAIGAYTITPRITISKAAGQTLSLGGSIGPSGTTVKTITSKKSGSVSPTSVIKRSVTCSKSGLITPAGTAAKFAARVLAGHISPSSVITASKLFLKSVAGQVSPTAAIKRDASKRLTGATSPTSAIAKFGTRSLSGQTSPAGTVKKLASKIVTASISPSAAIATVRNYARTLTGQTSPSSVITRSSTKPLVGNTSPAGTIKRDVTRRLTGATSPSGAVQSLKTKLLALAGSTSPIGTLVRSTSKLESGATSPSGSLVKLAMRKLAGSTSPSGAIQTLKAKFQNLSGSTSPSATMVRSVNKPLAGSTSPAATIVKAVARILAGQTSPAGATASLKTKLLSLAGVTSPSSALAKSTAKPLAGSAAPAGSLARSATRKLSGSMAPSSTVQTIKQTFRSAAGQILPLGVVRKDSSRSLAGSTSPVGDVARSISKSLGGFISAVGNAVTQFFQGGIVEKIDVAVSASVITNVELQASPVTACTVSAARMGNVELRAFTV